MSVLEIRLTIKTYDPNRQKKLLEIKKIKNIACYLERDTPNRGN